MSNGKQADEHLIDLLRQGNVKAFETVYDQYHAALYRTALKFVKSDELAREVVQEVFIKIWENRAQIRKGYSFAGFLFTATRNHIFNLLKKASREAALKQEILAYAELADHKTENHLAFREYTRAADEAIEHLPPQRKRIFKMCRQEGKSYEEVALSLGISKSTVRDHMVKALKSIRQYLCEHTDLSVSFAYLLTAVLGP